MALQIQLKYIQLHSLEYVAVIACRAQQNDGAARNLAPVSAGAQGFELHDAVLHPAFRAVKVKLVLEPFDLVGGEAGVEGKNDRHVVAPRQAGARQARDNVPEASDLHDDDAVIKREAIRNAAAALTDADAELPCNLEDFLSTIGYYENPEVEEGSRKVGSNGIMTRQSEQDVGTAAYDDRLPWRWEPSQR